MLACVRRVPLRCLGRHKWSIYSHIASRHASTNSSLLQVSEEVREAQASGKPVVALETTIYTHGFPYPENVALSSQLESLVRINGGIPATIGILNGVARVGMQAEELIELVSTAGSQQTWKISRRDLGFIGGLGLRGHKLNGGTTIASTMILAHLAGIKIFATGGLGGVHRGGENSMDISADLTELGRTPVAVISSGCKSFLDVSRTLEYLETQGVGVGTFSDGRSGMVDFPGFFSRDSGVKSPRVIQDEADAAAIIYAQSQYDLQSGLLFANPVPAAAGLPRLEMDAIIEKAVREADSQGIHGALNTPFILKRIRELSGGRTVAANKSLIEANVIRGTKVAVELAKLELRDKGVLERPRSFSHKPSSQSFPLPSHAETLKNDSATQTEKGSHAPIASSSTTNRPVDILVAGSLASDTLCDYQPLDVLHGPPSPASRTSNPAKMTQSVGGVGHNVALAAHHAGATVSLASVVADDLAGKSLLTQVAGSGVITTGVRSLPAGSDARTAQYIAFNHTDKDLVMAMADMSILAHPEMESEEWWQSTIAAAKPKWVVVDANWSTAILSNLVAAANTNKIPIAFEPVSNQKAARLLQRSAKIIRPDTVVPNNAISLAAPNVFELQAMYDAARDAGLFESQHWWSLINNLGMSSTGSRHKLTWITNAELVDQGVPQQSIQLLPYIPNLVTKLGAKGCLLTSLLSVGDMKLTDPDHTPFILARTTGEDAGGVGGLYMRLFPPSEEVRQEEIVSVNGVGDTMLGVLMAGLVKGKNLEAIIPIAQQAAVMTLKSEAAVSGDVRAVRRMLEM